MVRATSCRRPTAPRTCTQRGGCTPSTSGTRSPRASTQGWDLHPAHLVSRYAAVYGWLLPHLDDATSRVRAWREGAAAAGVLDEPATVSSLLRYLRFAVSSGAVDETEVLEATGLARDELLGDG